MYIVRMWPIESRAVRSVSMAALRNGRLVANVGSDVRLVVGGLLQYEANPGPSTRKAGSVRWRPTRSRLAIASARGGPAMHFDNIVVEVRLSKRAATLDLS